MSSKNVSGRRSGGEHKKRALSHSAIEPEQKCPKCGKNCFGSRRDAKRWARRILPGKQMREYQCEDQYGRVYYHITSVSTARVTKWRDYWHQRGEEEAS